MISNSVLSHSYTDVSVPSNVSMSLRRKRADNEDSDNSIGEVDDDEGELIDSDDESDGYSSSDSGSDASNALAEPDYEE